MRRLFRKPTLLCVLGLSAILIALYSIFFTSWESGTGIYIVFIHIPVIFVSIIAIIIDRLIALRTKISPAKLSLYELVVLIIGGIYFLYSQREVIIEPANGNLEYYLVLQNPGNLESDKTVNQFPFNKKILAEDNVIIVDDYWKTEVRPGWDDPQYQINTFQYEKYPRVKLVSKLTSDLSDKMNQDLIDELLKNKLSK